jgi:lactate dehydrogenase-like 2-hydroxyacid dehydrogenase
VTQKIDLMVVLEMPDYSRSHLAEKYQVHYWPDTATHNQRLDDPLLKTIRAVQTNGSYGLKRPMIEAMTNLEIICAVGAGYEGIDLEAARERGIIVTHNPGANANTVADQAWALLLGTVRRVAVSDRGVKAGRWDEVRIEMPGVHGKKLGIFGLGYIGSAVARRGAAGFDMDVGYFGRHRKPDVSYRYFDRLDDLAMWCDVLVICAPSDKATYHAVNREILRQLGPDGFVVNVSRGSLLDSDALADALRTGQIAGAGLDVIEGEPTVPESFRTLDNLVLSPHVGGFSPEAIRSMIHRVRDNLDAHFAGKPPLTPVP